jgi:hypothetical protein
MSIFLLGQFAASPAATHLALDHPGKGSNGLKPLAL